MNEDPKKTSGKTATAELEDKEAARPPVRSTTAGLGTFEKISSIAGATSGFGIAPVVSRGTGTGTPTTAMDTNPGITGVDLTFSEGMPGTTAHPTRFTEAEDAHWRQNYTSRPYVRSGSKYDEYRPAYQYGTDAAHRYQGRRWEDVEGDLERGWSESRGTSRSTWQQIKGAVRDAWDHVERALPGDSDRDGR